MRTRGGLGSFDGLEFTGHDNSVLEGASGVLSFRFCEFATDSGFPGARVEQKFSSPRLIAMPAAGLFPSEKQAFVFHNQTV